MKKFLIAGLIGLITFNSLSQAPAAWTSADMYLGIRKLNVLGSVLYVAAHPDDENTWLISYFSKERMFRTGYLSMTRGDGGQNLIGGEQGIELGMIRTQELMSARRIDGGEQFFTRAYDFGYSKNPEETFQKWDKNKILSDVVWVIRKFQPDVILTRFPTTGEGGHGHHTASAILAVEAFSAAADPTKYPEQLKFVQTWQPKKILWNSFNFRGFESNHSGEFKFDVGGYNPLLGKSYGEISAESRSQHKSQGFGVLSSRGEAFEYFRPLKGDNPSVDIFEGIETSWKRVPGAEKIPAMVDKIAASFDLLHPHKSVTALVELYQAINKLPNNTWKIKKAEEVKQLIEQCSGLWMDIYTDEHFAVQTDSIRFYFQFNNRSGGNDITLKKLTVNGFDTLLNNKLEKNKNLNFPKTFYVSRDKPITQPYWLREPMADGHFNVSDQHMIGEPDVQPAYVVDIKLEIAGQEFGFSKPVRYKFRDPVRGEVYWPLTVIPPYSLKLIPGLAIALNTSNPAVVKSSFEKRYTSNKPKNRILSAKKITGEKISSKEDSLFMNKGEVRTVSAFREHEIPVVKPASNSPQSNGTFRTITEEFYDRNSNEILHDITQVSYEHIPVITYFKPAKIDIKVFPYIIVGKKIGYIVGAGDEVPEGLEKMGYEVSLLTDKELSRNNLAQYDAIITGVRAYNTKEWMNNHYEKLMRYVEQGGNLIVQYNTSTNIGPVRAKIGPYPFSIVRTRITDENSPVNFLKPQHPVLNFPNKISLEDFKGWVQERSIYHGSDTTGKFETVISMNDPGEKQEDGSLIIAKYGKGYFSYTGLTFFRQLPAGVPGAYRLLANIIALNGKAF